MKGKIRLSGGRKLLSPKGLNTRPTTARVREAVTNLIGKRIHGADWLDLFSGSGVMGCEALQNGARRVLAIEQNKKTALICKSNLMTIAADTNKHNCAQVICHEVINFLKAGCQPSDHPDNRFDLVYLDPPYESNIYSLVLKNLLEGNWLKEDCLVICEHSSAIALRASEPWVEQDRRIYGSSALLLVSPP